MAAAVASIFTAATVLASLAPQPTYLRLAQHADVDAFLADVCATEFSAVAEHAPNVTNMLLNETRSADASVSDFVRTIVMAVQTAEFLEYVDMRDPNTPVLWADHSAAQQKSFEALTRASGCLIDEYGTVLRGVDLEQPTEDVGYTDILRWSTMALSAAAEEGNE